MKQTKNIATLSFNIDDKNYGFSFDLNTYQDNPQLFRDDITLGFKTFLANIDARLCDHQYHKISVDNKESDYCKYCSLLKQHIEGIIKT